MTGGKSKDVMEEIINQEEARAKEIREEIKEEAKEKATEQQKRDQEIEGYIKGYEEDSKEKPKGETKKKDLKWFTKFFSKGGLKKTNKVAVVYLRNNGNADLMEVETRRGFFKIKGKSFHEDRDCVYTVTKDRIPLMIQKEWDIMPIGTKRRDDEIMSEKFAQLEDHVLTGIRAAELVKTGGESDGKFSGKQVVIYAILAIIAGALFVSYL